MENLWKVLVVLTISCFVSCAKNDKDENVRIEKHHIIYSTKYYEYVIDGDTLYVDNMETAVQRIDDAEPPASQNKIVLSDAQIKILDSLNGQIEFAVESIRPIECDAFFYETLSVDGKKIYESFPAYYYEFCNKLENSPKKDEIIHCCKNIRNFIDYIVQLNGESLDSLIMKTTNR